MKLLLLKKANSHLIFIKKDVTDRVELYIKLTLIFLQTA